MNKISPKVYFVFALFFLVNSLFAQTFSDGPMELRVRFADFKVNYNETDASVLGVGFAPDEPVVKLWARDNADVDGVGWQGGTCNTLSSSLPATIPINQVILNNNYTGATVPQFYDLRIDAWEDDNGNSADQILGFSCSGGTYCSFETPSCCGVVVFGTCVGITKGDDNRCNMDPWLTQRPYRNAPPCQWFDQGFMGGSTCSGHYEVRMETYYKFTNGVSCAAPIDLGTITSGATLSHYNSTECYSNSHAASPGNDVWYKFHANGPIGINASLCGSPGGSVPAPPWDSYLYLYSSCGQLVADTSNDDGCGTGSGFSSLSYSICQAGDYYLVVDGKSASDQGIFTLTVTDNPNFVFAVNPVKQDVSCFGGNDGQITANIQGGLPPYTITWSPSSLGTGQTVSGLGQGTYSVTVTDSKGCQATASVQIDEPTQLTATTTAVPVSCGGACDGSATVTVQGGTPPYSYAWNSLPPQQLANAVLLCASTYTVTVSDSKSCTVTATATVQNTTTVLITLDSLKHVQCFGANNGGIYLTSTGGQTPFTFAWSNFVNTEDNPNLGPGNYTITITDNTGCTAGNTYTITEPPVLTSSVAYTHNPTCNGESTGIVNITVGGGVQPYSYQWNAPTNAVTQNLNLVTAGNHAVTVTDANGCTATSSAILTEPSPFAPNLQVGGLLCYGASNGTASLNVSGSTPPYTYFWSNFETTASVTGLHAGPFSVIISDANGCDTVLTGTIAVPGEISIQLTSNEPPCSSQGGSITSVITGGTPPYTYAWSGGLAPVANPSAGSGSYTLTVTDANGCTETSSVGVNAPSSFTVNAIGINPTCKDDSTGVVVANTIGGTPPYTYAWNSTSSDTVALTHLRPGTFLVTVTDANGCTAVGSALLRDPDVDPENCKSDKYVVLVPTAFSPNGDNVNDRLVAIMRNVQSLEFRVLNRWGEVVYENHNMQPGDGWDGTFRGRPQPIGTYIYVYNVTYNNGVSDVKNGSATLVR